MRPSRTRGFSLLIVIMLLTAMGAALVLMSQGSNDMLFDLQRMQRLATERNLRASAMAWAARHAPRASAETPTARSLDVEAFETPGAGLRVTLASTGPGQVQVTIETSCPMRGRTVKRESEHILQAPSH